MDGCDTLPKLFLHRCRTLGARTAHRDKALGLWRAHSWDTFLDSARAIGLGLAALGLKRGEVVSILSEAGKEWIYADLGIQCVGGIVSGIHPACDAQGAAFLLRASGSRFVLVQNDEQLDKFLEIRDGLPEISACIVLDADGLQDFHDERVLFLDALYRMGREVHREDPGRFEREAGASQAGDVAMLIHTAGTTGRPKGAMISHGNAIAAASSMLRALPLREGEERLCFLPLAHGMERLASVFVPIAAAGVVSFAENAETVLDNLREVSPAFLAAGSLVWERIHTHVSALARDASPLGRWAFRRALACGMARAGHLMAGRSVPLGLEAQFRLWDLAVLANLRRMIGLDRARYLASGAAPIAPELVHWYWALGLPMLQGYGLAESAGLLSINLPGRNRTGSVGMAVPGVEIRTAADGEIVVKGPSVSNGYWNDPDGTAETIREGWLHTGDRGRIDEDGFLWIDGRAGDTIAKAAGKTAAPATTEN